MTPGGAFATARIMPRRVWKWALWTALMVATTRAVGAQEEKAAVMGLCAREPDVRVDCYPPVANFPNATEEACRAQGCCWKPLDNDGIPCAFDALGAPNHARCTKVSNASRVACRNPRFALDGVVGGDVDTCHAIGCCFDPDDGSCFQPFFEGYELLTLEETARGWRGALVLRRFLRGPFGNDVALLELHVIKESASRVRVRITDPSFPRYEVSMEGLADVGNEAEVVDEDEARDEDSEDQHRQAEASDYHVHFYERPFGIAVTRRKTHEVLFNSTPSSHANTSFNGLVFENQFLEISTHLTRNDTAQSPLLFGLGERWGAARLRADRKGDHYPMFSRRAQAITSHTRGGGDNLGGVHPFYLQVLESGRSHGVFFRSSNAMEVVTQDDALTFRSTGGVLDFEVFSGPTALDVASEYTRVVGRPEMPPFWALGYHFGKQGHDSLEDAMIQVTGLRAAGVPLDAYWQDVDYMYDDEAFSLNERHFPLQETRGFVDDLHFNNQYYMVLMTSSVPTDPGSQDVDHALVVEDEDTLDLGGSKEDTPTAGATGRSQYFPLEQGRALDVFVKGIQGEQYAEKLVGSQWSAFVDFSHPNATTYWREMLGSFHEQVLPFDGVWFNADEPSSTCDLAYAGSDHLCGGDVESSHGSSGGDLIAMASEFETIQRRGLSIEDGSFVRTQDVAFPFDPYRQPFVPGQSMPVRGGHGNLNSATLPMAALHHASLHYNMHSLYGHQQAKVTRQVLDDVLKRRSISMSRATFAGDGKYAGQLGGEFNATWDNLRLSIASVIQTSLLGIPFSGPTVGGNGIGMTKELSIRWNQAASFFPLFRNHATKDANPQSPIDFDQETANIVREVSLQRSRHLAYMYSQFYHAHAHGNPVIRALALEFPEDPVCRDVETQYLVGPALMISPVIDEHSISVQVYFPNATWYDQESGRKMITVATNGEDFGDRYVQVLTPLQKLQIHIRGGHIVPTQEPSVTTAMTKRGVYRLVVALNPSVEDLAAEGDLFIDDGDSLYSIRDKRYSLLSFKTRLVRDNILEFKSKVVFHGYDGPEMHVDLEKIVVFGLHGYFLANSSLILHGPSSHDDTKVEYFEQANTLVLSQMRFPIGGKLELRVEAKSMVADEPSGQDEGGVDDKSDEDQGSQGQVKDEDGGTGEAEAHGQKEPDQDEGESPAPITGEQQRNTGIKPAAIAGIVIAGIAAVVVISLFIRRRRLGYNTIT